METNYKKSEYILATNGINAAVLPIICINIFCFLVSTSSKLKFLHFWKHPDSTLHSNSQLTHVDDSPSWIKRCKVSIVWIQTWHCTAGGLKNGTHLILRITEKWKFFKVFYKFVVKLLVSEGRHCSKCVKYKQWQIINCTKLSNKAEFRSLLKERTISEMNLNKL